MIRSGPHPLGRLRTITDPANGVTEFSYDNRDNLIAVKDPKNQTHRFAYDRLNRKRTETRPLGQTRAYANDPTGNLIQVTDPKGQAWQYTYDDAGRRVGEAHYLSASDAAANANAVKTITYRYNDLDRPTGYHDGTTAATTDYDAPQLRKLGETVDFGSFSLSYRYDYSANGLKKFFTGPDGVTVTYTYDANNQLAQVQLPAGRLTVNSYTWTTDSLYLKEGENYSFYQNDHFGTPQKLLTQSGQVVWSAKAQAFGLTTVDPTSTITNPLRFPGQYYDAESGLHYDWHRYYDPKTGRYITTDPMNVADHVQRWSSNFDAPDHPPLEINPYAYVADNPLRWIDSTGRAANPPICRGPDCIDPPYDPTPDRPKPARNRINQSLETLAHATGLSS